MPTTLPLRSRSTQLVLRRVVTASLVSVWGLSSATFGQRADYPALYTERAGASSFNVEVTRGLAFRADSRVLYSIHSYAGSLLRFDLDRPILDGVMQPDAVWPTLIDPVAVALYEDQSSVRGVYVLGQGTHGLARHDPLTGAMLDLFVAPAMPDPATGVLPRDQGFNEPADLVIDSVRGEAYVSCMGSDTVVRIDLKSTPMREIERWVSNEVPGAPEFQLKRPRFLHWDGARLYVAPFQSGNNTMMFGNEQNFTNQFPWIPFVGNGIDADRVVDGYSAPEIVRGLPDIDLFRITPAPVLAPGLPPAAAQIEALFTHAGTLLTRHGVHPTDGQYWLLGIDSLNASARSEPALAGVFAQNLATIAALPPSGGSSPIDVFSGRTVLDGASVAPGHGGGAIPFPYALAFDSASGLAAVASSTLSRVVLLDRFGARRGVIPTTPGGLDHGRVIRDAAFRRGSLFLYCQGSSNIVVWPMPGGIPGAAAVVALDLQSDPTPASVAAGRAIFYDASRSEHSRTSCGVCHPGGESDLLVWELKDGVADFKDPMMTQTLKGLRETFPYHWRGERGLGDFNHAFVALLGGDQALATTPTGGGGQASVPSELQSFEDFLLSLRPAANPRELLSRQLPAGLTLHGEIPFGLPRLGAEVFAPPQNPTGGPATCNTCHALPTGGSGSIVADNSVTPLRLESRNATLEAIQLSNFLTPRDQPLVEVQVAIPGGGPIGPVVQPLLGHGWLHAGNMPSLADFMERRFGAIINAASSDGTATDVAAFVLALDTGTPPAAHHAVVMTAQDRARAANEVRDVLLQQARAGWLDVVVRGPRLDSVPPGLGAADRGWLFDPSTGTFQSDELPSPGVTRPASLRTFFNAADTATAPYVFYGVPRGHGERLALDFDADGLVNGAERGPNAWVHDRDGDGDPDGYEVANGGHPDNPMVRAADTTPPALLLDPQGAPVVELVLARATSGVIAFEATEDVRWRLTASAPSGMPSVVAECGAFARVHSAHVHGLRASPLGVPLWHTMVLTLADRAGLTQTITLADPFATLPDRNGNLPLLSPRTVITELEAYNRATVGAGVSANVRVQVGAFDDPLQSPLAEWVVIAQVLRRAGPNEPWQKVPRNEIRHDGPNWNAATQQSMELDRLWNGAPYPAEAVPGHLITFPATVAPGGFATIRVGVTTLAAGAEVALHVVAVLPAAANRGTPSAPEFALGDFSSWPMGATAPQRREVRLNP